MIVTSLNSMHPAEDHMSYSAVSFTFFLHAGIHIFVLPPLIYALSSLSHFSSACLYVFLICSYIYSALFLPDLFCLLVVAFLKSFIAMTSVVVVGISLKGFRFEFLSYSYASYLCLTENPYIYLQIKSLWSCFGFL